MKTEQNRKKTSKKPINIVKIIEKKNKRVCLRSIDLDVYSKIYGLYLEESKNPEFYRENLQFLKDNIRAALRNICKKTDGFYGKGDGIEFKFLQDSGGIFYISEMSVRTDKIKSQSNSSFRGLFERDAYNQRNVTRKNRFFRG